LKEGGGDRGRYLGEEVPARGSLGRIVTAGEELPSSPPVDAPAVSSISLMIVSSEPTDDSVPSPSEEVSGDGMAGVACLCVAWARVLLGKGSDCLPEVLPWTPPL
jgi:hypothetical protein